MKSAEIKKDVKYATSLFNKYNGIRNHTRNFAFISLFLAVYTALKFTSLWYVAVGFVVVAVVLFLIRKSYKFKFNVACVLLGLATMIEECEGNGMSEEQIKELLDKKVEDIK
jgi:hypothetical protein